MTVLPAAPGLRVSVAMTTYNGADFIDEQIATLVNQTSPPYEIVITDDMSSDDTVARLHRAAEHSAVPLRIYVNESRLGWRANFMKAASLCTGDLVAFSDQDDVWSEDKLATVVPFFDDPSVSMVVHRAWTIDGGGAVSGELQPQGQPLDAVVAPLTLDVWHCPLGFSMVFVRGLLDYGEFWSQSHDQLDPTQPAAHDQWFYFLAHVFGTIVFIPDKLVSYRLHGGNTVGHRKGRRAMRDLVVALRGSQDKADSRLAFLSDRDASLAAIETAFESRRAEVVRARKALDGAKSVMIQRREMYSIRNPVSRYRRWRHLRKIGVYSPPTLPISRSEAVRDVAVMVLGISS